MMRRLFILLIMVVCPLSVRAHIGSNDVFFEGTAGKYPVRVNVKMPGVIPGRAEISVRVTDDFLETGESGSRALGCWASWITLA